jgi:hypothetical protein
LASSSKEERAKFGLAEHSTEFSEGEERNERNAHDRCDGGDAAERSAADPWDRHCNVLTMEHGDRGFFDDISAHEQHGEGERLVDDGKNKRLSLVFFREMQPFGDEHDFGED